MSNISKLIEELCPDGVEFKKLESVTEKAKSIKWGDKSSSDIFQYVDLSSISLGGTKIETTTSVTMENAPSRAKQIIKTNDIIFATTRPAQMRCALVKENLNGQIASTGYCVLRINDDSIKTEFIFHYLRSDIFREFLEQNQVPGNYPSISDKSLKRFVVPVPPLVVQEEIVRILDRFTLLEAELEAELEARRKQYAFYQQKIFAVKSQFDSSVPSLKILDISKKISAGGDVPSDCMKGQVFPSESHPYPVYSNGSKGNDLYGYSSTYKVEGPCVTVSARGTIGYHAVRDGKFSPIVRLITIVPDISKITVEYLNYVLDITEVGSSGGSIPQLTVPKIKDVEIPVPPLKEQKRIVDILDRFDALVNDISSGLPAEIAARRKQYEHYRDQLLTFKELEPAGS